MNKIKLLKAFLIFILIQPILDLLTSISSYFVSIPLSINVIVKMVFIIVVAIYLLFYSKSKYRKPSLIYAGIFAVYCIVYFFTKLDLRTIGNFVNEATYLFKFFYWIFVAMGYLNLFDDTNFDNKEILKYLQINVILYFIFLIIPILTHSDLASYGVATMGSRGWFVSANEMAALLALIFPLIFLIFIKEKRNVFDYISLICSGFSLALIGTKTSFLALILTILVAGLYLLIKNIKNKKIWLLMVIIILGLGVGYKYIPGIDTLKRNFNSSSQIINEDDNYLTIVSKYLLRVRRNLYFEKKDIYSNASLTDKILGIGFTNRESINNERVARTVEIDPIDILFSFGIIGFIIYLLPFIYLGVELYKKKLKLWQSLENKIYLYIFMLAIFISIFAGHVFSAPSVSIYVALSYTLLLNNRKEVK